MQDLTPGFKLWRKTFDVLVGTLSMNVSDLRERQDVPAGDCVAGSHRKSTRVGLDSFTLTISQRLKGMLSGRPRV